jgi:hypothetical protein
MAYGFDPGILLQTQGVQVPDPVKQYATALSLGDLARRGEADQLQLRQARKAADAADAYDAALPGLVQSGFTTDSIVSAINQNPRAAGMILKESDARKKAALDQGKTEAETRKIDSETRKMDLAMVGGMAQSILSNPNSSARDLQTLGGIMQRVGINPGAFGDPSQDPEGWLRGVAGASIDAAKQIELQGQKETRAETARSNRANETLTGLRDAETARYHTGTLNIQGGQLAETRANNLRVDARTRESTAATREATAGHRMDAETQALAKMIDSNALPNLMTSANALDATITKYNKVRDMPGVGMADAAMPPLFRTAEGNKVRAEIQAVANDLLKLYSGGAVTANEAERRATEMMASGQFNETDLRNAWPLVKGRINAAVQNARAGFSPAAVSAYESRGGIKLRPIGSDPAREAVQGAGGPLQQAPAGSGVDWVYTPGGR